MKRWTLLLAAALFALYTASSWAMTLSAQQRARIHPDFQALLASAYPELDLKGGSMARLSRSPAAANLYHAIIYVTDPAIVRSAGVRVNSVYPGFVTAQVSPAQILALSQLDGVKFLDPGSTSYPVTDISVPATGAGLLHGGFLNSTVYKGSGAIVLIYDTGIDWKHGDFRSPSDPTKSRILAIWDQTLTAGAGEAPPSGLGYGVEYTQAQINAELAVSPPGLVREKDINGHGTHVAGTAAGNGLAHPGAYIGMAPEADIIVVKGGDATFGESQMIDGLTYAENKAVEFGKPIVVNWSIGGQTGPHDGTRGYEVAANSFVSNPGRVVVIAAGNDGANEIHTGGTAGSATISFTVPSYTHSSGTGTNQFLFDLWFNGDPAVTATAISANGIQASATNGNTANSPTNTDGLFTVYNINPYLPDGAREIQLWVRDNGVNYPAAGSWTLTLENAGTAVNYDGWLASRSVGDKVVALDGGDVNETVSSPGTAAGGITAASYVTRWQWPSYTGLNYLYSLSSDRTSDISTFSSIGPTRDLRQKPDLAAPGQGIAAALSTFWDTTGQSTWIVPDQKHFIDQGTSMATPHITGAVALILGAYPQATSDGIKSQLESAAINDSYTGAVPNYTWGYGKLDIAQAMAHMISPGAVVTRTLLSNDGTAANALAQITGATKCAVRFAAPSSGQVAGLTVHLTTVVNRPVRGNGNLICGIYSDNGGVPGAQIGSSVSWPIQRLVAGTPNPIGMIPAGANVTSGSDFYAVISMGTPTDTIELRTENVSTGTQSLTFDGANWTQVSTNHRIRAAVASVTGLTAIGQASNGVPLSYNLEQNYPNPFNPSTRVRYNIGQKGMVTLKVFDILGREVAALVNEEEGAGTHQVTWNGRDNRNLPVTSGVYFYRLQSGGFTKTNRMVLLK